MHNNINQSVPFPSSYRSILDRVKKINPLEYGATRNYLDGQVTYLSPYISRGVISTKFILSEVLSRGYKWHQIEKFIQELAWRDYWQQLWIEKGEKINFDLKQQQNPVSNSSIPKALIEAQSGIVAIDNAIASFYKTGYLHNHVRMYIASIACNIAHCHWYNPAKWMYYHLLDGDWASNALSWQWVAGTNSNKKYVANQANINKYCYTNQNSTFLDVSYEDFPLETIPNVLKETVTLNLKTPLPRQSELSIDSTLPTCIYNVYNLDPNWKKDQTTNNILLLEPSHFKEYPVSKNTIDFILALSRDNIDNIQIYVGEFSELISAYSLDEIYYKEHHLNKHYKGIEEPRDWMFKVKGYYPSFFSFWKQCKKELKNWN